jgi:hypothetical protein
MSSRYQEWLKHVFDHEGRGHLLPEWYRDENAPSFEASDEEMAELISQTFLNAGKNLIKYTDKQVDQGIWYFVSASCGNFLHSLQSPKVPLKKRQEAIQNIFHLYSDCFAKRCAETLGHLSEEGSLLNSSCYMFWDICRFADFDDDLLENKETQDTVLKVLEKILAIEHRVCRESSLHGLSHIFYSRPEHVHEIIDSFFEQIKIG